MSSFHSEWERGYDKGYDRGFAIAEARWRRKAEAFDHAVSIGLLPPLEHPSLLEAVDQQKREAGGE